MAFRKQFLFVRNMKVFSPVASEPDMTLMRRYSLKGRGGPKEGGAHGGRGEVVAYSSQKFIRETGGALIDEQ